MESLLELLMNPKRSRSVQARVEKRAAKLVCLDNSDGYECERSMDEPGGGKGRCAKHYQRLCQSKKNRSFADQRKIDNDAIRAGTLLYPQEIRALRKKLKGIAS